MAIQTTTTTQGTKESNQQLQQLLAMLMSGGTPEYRRSQQQRMTELNNNRATQARYSPDAAFADAQGLMNQIMRRALEGQVAQLIRSAEGAGTSQSSMRALLTNDALSRAAEGGATAGLGAAANYGQIVASLAGVNEGLTRPDNSNIQAILEALQLVQQANQVQTTESQGGGGSTGGRTWSGGRSDSVLGMPSTDAFFNRPGGILSNAANRGGVYAAGPTLTNEQILKTIQDGIPASQPLSSVPNINTLYSSAIRF